MEIAYLGNRILFIRRKLKLYTMATDTVSATFFCISWMDLQIINSYL